MASRSESKEVQDWLRNPRKAIHLAKGGSRKHAIVIPTIINEISPHLRHLAFEALLNHCSEDENSLELAEALLECIGSLKSHFGDRDSFWSLRDSKHEERGVAQSSSKAASPRTLERIIIQHSNIIPSMLHLCSKKSSWFNKEKIQAETDLDSTVMKKHILDTAYCLKVLTMNAIVEPSMYKDTTIIRVCIRFWLATVLASKPGDVNPIVHETLFCCGGIYSRINDNTMFRLLVEENGDDAHRTAALLVSELRATMKKDIGGLGGRASYLKGLAALIHLNIIMAFMPYSIKSLRGACINLNVVSVLTSAVLKSIQEGNDQCDRTNMIAYITIVRSAFSFREGVQWAVEAIQAGILTIIATCHGPISRSGHPLSDDDAKSFRKIINSLTLYLTRYSVVRAAVNALASIELEKLEKMKDLPFFTAWKIFLSTLFERAVFMSRLSHTISSSERVMHCEVCIRIIPLQSLKKCEKCERAFYCSRSCQRKDWRDSDHKTVCEKLEKENIDVAPMSTSDRFFMGHLACYDIRRHMKSLSKILQGRYSGVPANELRFCVYYEGATDEPTCISVSPLLSKDSPEFFARVAQETKDQPEDLESGPRLVEVIYYGGTPKRARSFHFVIPQEYFSAVPKLSDQYQEIAQSVKGDFRSKAKYWSDPDGDSSDVVELSDDVDEVGAILSFMQMTKGKSQDPALFPSTFKYTWKDIEKAASDCRSCWPFDGEGIL
ncbi:hypothetical protein SCHPADRAFT_931766 [Schizopora paradoxa]|uniref:MYND-type domain-containing protein n=1 Tax=Schizopora paradoxa TaxID=27342 RepID=A0A0H2RUM2_9AGAM|nr:hypothetical protein SCHPADRAFT_931766 [Schizopora paradoxa]